MVGNVLVSINSTSEEVRRDPCCYPFNWISGVSINSTSEEVRSLSLVTSPMWFFIVSINSTSEEVRSAETSDSIVVKLDGFH